MKLTDKLHTFTCLHIPTSKYIQMEMMEFDDRSNWETTLDEDTLMIASALTDGADFKLGQVVKGKKNHIRDVDTYLNRCKETSKNGIDFNDEYFDPTFKGHRLKYNFGTKKLFLEALIPAVINPSRVVEFAKFYTIVEKLFTQEEMVKLFDSAEDGGSTDIDSIDWDIIPKLLKKKGLSIEEIVNDVYLPSMVTVNIPGLDDGMKVSSLSEFHFEEKDITIADVLADIKEFDLFKIEVPKSSKLVNRTERQSKPMTAKDKREVTAWWKSATKEEIRYLLGKVQKTDNIDYV